MEPAFPAQHLAQDRLGHVVEAVEGRIDHRVPVPPGHHQEKTVRRHPGVVHQHVDPLQPPEEVVDRAFRLGGVADVELHRLPVPAGLPDQPQRLRRRLVVAFIRDYHLIPVRGQIDGNGPADPAAAARNDGNLLFTHDSLSLCFPGVYDNRSFSSFFRILPAELRGKSSTKTIFLGSLK